MMPLHSLNDFKKMNFSQYKKEFEEKASKSGYTDENIRRCLDYAKPLIEKNLPIIYNTSHLSVLVGYKKEYIKRSVVYTPYFYRDFKIKKRNGKMRTISEPLPSLKEIQSWILENILENVKVSPFAKAYRKNVSIIENIKFHRNQPKVFIVDLQNFFPSIKANSVENIFLSLGYSKIISNLLAKLCTRDGHLPQGAPTSPYLSNIFFKSADDKIIKYCLENHIKYTRYADDLSFSGNFDENKLLKLIEETVISLGLTLNSEKTKLMKPNERQTVTGIVVNEKIQVVFHKRNKLRQDLYYINKFGLDSHMDRKGIKKRNYLEHLLGKVNFILQINPMDEEFKRYKEHLIKLKKVNEQ
ncbi:MAG: reverse transcriptase family protein [Saprospiraceae bacterium]|nr:reverse transcriptase family protein [Saprospiraceae bacterium]